MHKPTRPKVAEDIAAIGQGTDTFRPYINYLVLVLAPIATFVLLLWLGKNLPAAVGIAAPAAELSATGFNLAILLKQTAVVIAVAGSLE